MTNELTDRENWIVDLVARGLTHKAAAEHIGISRRALEKSLACARGKAHVDSTLQLVIVVKLAQL